MSLPAVAMLVCFFAWCAIGMPIGFAMLASAFLYLLLNGQDMGLVAFQSLNGLFKSFVLLATQGRWVGNGSVTVSTSTFGPGLTPW